MADIMNILVLVFLLASGILLAAEVLNAIPGLGKGLKKLAQVLSGFGAVIGIIDIVLFILLLVL
jgi:hypothetical protein